MNLENLFARGYNIEKRRKRKEKNMSIKMNDIDNTKLEQAMQAYISQQDKENLMKLVLALQGAQLFVPAMAVPQEKSFQPYVLRNKEGILYMPAFTCQAKLAEGRRYQGALKLHYRQCVSMLLDHPTMIEGIALNPHTDNLMLKTQMLELSRKMEQEAPQMKTASIKLDDFRKIMRHDVEFHLIPKILYEKKLEFLDTLSGETLCELYKKPYTAMKQEQHYNHTKDDFEIMELNIKDELNIMQIMLPSKYLFQTNCREIYIAWNPKTERVGYYMLEKGTDQEEEQFFLDIVKEDGSCEKLEDAPSEGNVLNRIMELFEAVPE